MTRNLKLKITIYLYRLKDDNRLTFAENFILSGAAAIISKTIAAPIERVKLLVQNQHEMIKQGRLDKPYNGVIDCTLRTFKSEGLLPFWRGNLANVIRYFPTQALNFSFNGRIKQSFKSKPTDPFLVRLGTNVASGGLAGSLSLCFVYSLDYTRTRLANDAKSAKGGERQFNGIIDVFKKTIATDGIAGLYRGFVISCVGIAVYRGLYFGLYDTARPILMKENIDFKLAFLLAYSVTVCAGLCSYPIDTIRRRMMMTSGNAIKYKNSFDCFQQIVKNDGYAVLMKGAGANILRGVAGAGVISGFDKLREYYIFTRQN